MDRKSHFAGGSAEGRSLFSAMLVSQYSVEHILQTMRWHGLVKSWALWQTLLHPLFTAGKKRGSSFHKNKTLAAETSTTQAGHFTADIRRFWKTSYYLSWHLIILTCLSGEGSVNVPSMTSPPCLYAWLSRLEPLYPLRTPDIQAAGFSQEGWYGLRVGERLNALTAARCTHTVADARRHVFCSRVHSFAYAHCTTILKDTKEA